MPIDSPHVIEIIEKLLNEAIYPRDALPYTSEFLRLKRKYEEKIGLPITNHQFWKLLSRIGKRGGFLKKGARKKAQKNRIPTEWQQLEILRLFPDGIGGRDDLPYTKRFDELHKSFLLLTGSNFTRYEFWRAVSGVAKKSRKPKPIFVEAPLGGLLPDTVDILERNNPWWRGKPQKKLPSILRWAYRDVYNRLNSGIASIVALKGSRQVGKTTIQQQLIDHLLRFDGIQPNRILRVQFDKTPSLGVLSNPIEQIIKWYEANVIKKTLNEAAIEGKPVYLLFDEVQNLNKWSEQLKSVVDNSDVKVFVTGSSALRIQKGNDSLPGRLTAIELGPLRLNEIAKFRSLEFIEPFSVLSNISEWTNLSFWHELVEYGKKNVKSINEVFRYFSLYGGYPICHKESLGVEELAAQIVTDVVERTIVHEQVKGASENIVRELFALLCRYDGERISNRDLIKQISTRLGSNIKESEITASLNYLEKTLLVCFLKPLEMLRKKSNGYPTVCLCDHFIRYAVTKEPITLLPQELRSRNQSIATQAGHIVEGIIGAYFSRLSGISVATFPGNRNEDEVDIVLTVGTQRIPIEVKYRNSFSCEDIKGLRAFCNKPHYETPFGIVITQEKTGLIEDNIIAVPAKTLLTMV